MTRIGRALGAFTGLASGGAWAQEPTGLPVIGVPVPGGVGYQPAVTEVAHDMHWLSNGVHGIMLVIVAFVVALLAVVILRYNRRSNATPAGFTHNTPVEIAWTIVPVLILIVIGSFSLPILFRQLEIPESDLTVKATGNQWFWTYEYPDNEFSFDSLMLAEDELAAHGYGPDLYLLATDTSLVVPVNAVVRVQVTGADVIHAWAVPAFGVKMDAVPGRLAETWFRAEKEGVFFGQCSELCGKDHSYMPITVKVVSPEAYAAWLDWAIDEYGGMRPGDAAAEDPAAGAAAAAEGGAAAPAEEAPAEAAPAEEAEAPATAPSEAAPADEGEAPEAEVPAEEPPTEEAPADEAAPPAD
jgi:cytochrome c oxidase subunit 2